MKELKKLHRFKIKIISKVDLYVLELLLKNVNIFTSKSQKHFLYSKIFYTGSFLYILLVSQSRFLDFLNSSLNKNCEMLHYYIINFFLEGSLIYRFPVYLRLFCNYAQFLIYSLALDLNFLTHSFQFIIFLFFIDF